MVHPLRTALKGSNLMKDRAALATCRLARRAGRTQPRAAPWEIAPHLVLALKGRQQSVSWPFLCPFRAKAGGLLRVPGRCPGLHSWAPSGQNCRRREADEIAKSYSLLIRVASS